MIRPDDDGRYGSLYPDGVGDRWFLDGLDEAHQRYLDELRHVEDEPEVEFPESMRESALREMQNPTPPGAPDDPAAIAALIREIRDRIHAQALTEHRADHTAGHVREDGAGDQDGRGDEPGQEWQR